MTTPDSRGAATAPVAKRVSTSRSHHSDIVVDEYAWLADREDPDAEAYLVAENAYAEARTAAHAPLRKTIFEEIRRRTLETDISVPTRVGRYWYYSRTVEEKQYPIYCRRAVIDIGEDPPVSVDGSPLAGEEVLLDANIEAGGSDFFALGTFDVSVDANLLAYSVDLAGDERFTLRVKDLRTGDLLADEIRGAYYGSAWSADSSIVFYLTVDAAWRPNRLWRHEIGTPTSADVLVLEEPDERFRIDASLSRSREYIVVDVHSKVTSEVHLIDATAPMGPPRLVRRRRQGVEYQVEHDPAGRRLLIVHNAPLHGESADDFALAVTPADDPGAWTELIAPVAGTRLLGVDAFAGSVVVSLRRDGLTGLRVLPGVGDAFDLSFPEPIYTVELEENPEYDTASIRLAYSSFVTPTGIYDYDLGTREMVLRKQKPVLGGYDPGAYEQHREWATASDGTPIPISIVSARSTPRDGTAPMVLYGYGSYESSTDPWFSIPRLSLLDRGFVFAVAHVRGGGEMGRGWYEDGKMLAKRNTFTDFVACAEHVTATAWTSSDRLVARGGSAGGLLVGAAANLAPAAFAGIVAEVPFVDPLNSMLDTSLPLTVSEWEEWGNPSTDVDTYYAMRSYSPYENVAALHYPAIFATASRYDTRVLFHEPAKWIARLRATAPRGDYVLKTEMGAGHGGPSGRYDSWREEAFLLAWIINLVGSTAQVGTEKTNSPLGQ